ncbi:MAG: DUF169 domain-containing protein [Bacteroidota bacterium]|nr:DUF169 domain-containing protein [Bacteroidota bacterium]
MKESFLDRWGTYFPDAALPLAFFYSDTPCGELCGRRSTRYRCLIADVQAARKGKTVCLDEDGIACSGGKRYLGFSQTLRPHFEEFLSSGIPGELEGERYKKSPDIVAQLMQSQPPFTAPAKYAVFKRWDILEQGDNPLIVIFFATPDILAGLFTLANFDETDPYGVITPMGSGCSSIVYRPYRELLSDHPRAVLGMFDVSARPYIPHDELSFAVPWPKFLSMFENMEESFLITHSWEKIRHRIASTSRDVPG